MHTPDGFLTSWVCYATLIISLSVVGYSVFKVRFTKELALKTAAVSSGIFALQMLNFSIGNGTSGHLIGGALAAVLLGPYAAVLAMTSVIVVQALVFADGGLISIGANVLLMAIISVYSAHLIGKSVRNSTLSVAAASIGSVVVAAFSAAILLGISGTVAFGAVIPAMVLTHVFIGVGEALITIGALSLLRKESWSARTAVATVIGAVAVMSLALPFASQSPDGLESVALNMGFYDGAVELFSTPFAGYTLFGVESYVAVLMAGMLGMALTFGVTYLISSPSRA